MDLDAVRDDYEIDTYNGGAMSSKAAHVVRLVADTRARFDTALAAGAITADDHELMSDTLDVIEGRYLGDVDEEAFASIAPQAR
jgi:hypothetical protein